MAGLVEAGAMTDAPARPQPELVTAEGPWGGPVYSCRGAEMRCSKGGHVCALRMEGPPCTARLGVIGTVAPLLGLWEEEGRLPSYMRAVPKPGGT